MAREFHGITSAFYQINASATYGTQITNINAPNSEITFPDQPTDQTDLHGNVYYQNQYAEVTIEALDLTNTSAVLSDHTSLSRGGWKLILDNGEEWKTGTSAVRVQQVKPTDIMGEAEGRADGRQIVFRYPYDDFTIT